MRYLVRDNLFLGNFCAAAEILQNGSSEVSHVLSVLPSASISIFAEWRNLELDTEDIAEVYVGDQENGGESSLPSSKLLYSLEYAGKDLAVKRMAVIAQDEEWENLLDIFDVCFDFIETGRKQGGVLVHCYAGQSRSASIVTAYLMKLEQLSREDALKSLRNSYKDIRPNIGFLEQLELFEKMNFKVDRSNPLYKRFRLKFLAYLYKEGKQIDGSKLRADPGVLSVKEAHNIAMYCCKKCKKVVALQDHVMDHNPDLDACTSIFVEPLSWMKEVEHGAAEGKLSCGHCNARLGSFKWSGNKCSCGNKVTPAFQLHLSRLDIHNDVNNFSTAKHVNNRITKSRRNLVK